MSRLIGIGIALMVCGGAQAAEVFVTNVGELELAVEGAQPGDEIILRAGTYALTSPLYPTNAGLEESPIVVRAEIDGEVTIEVYNTMGFELDGPWWRFEDLHFLGVCATDSLCEHAFHIIGDADHTVVRNCVMENFNAQIKGNGNDYGNGMVYPDDVLIEGNEMFSTEARNTGNPVTPIDVVGGKRWIVRANFIHDFEKGNSDRVSYAAFFKGNSSDGIFERNLVACSWLHSGGLRVGLSFGGGGSSPDSICEESTCAIEHTNGIMRNNIIAHCSDVGIYLNEAVNSRIYNNTLLDNTGLDVRFSPSTADIRNNLLSGEIRLRDGGTATSGSNLQYISDEQWTAWFVDATNLDFTLIDGSQIVDLGESLDLVTEDYCTNDRNDGLYDLGPVEYDGEMDCVTTAPYEGNPGDGGCDEVGLWWLLGLLGFIRRKP